MPDIGERMPVRQDGKSTQHWTMQAIRDMEDHINSALALVEILSPSGYHWLNYDEDKLTEEYRNFKARQRVTENLSLTKTKLQEAQIWFREACRYGSEVEDGK